MLAPIFRHAARHTLMQLIAARSTAEVIPRLGIRKSARRVQQPSRDVASVATRRDATSTSCRNFRNGDPLYGNVCDTYLLQRGTARNMMCKNCARARARLALHKFPLSRRILSARKSIILFYRFLRLVRCSSIISRRRRRKIRISKNLDLTS